MRILLASPYDLTHLGGVTNHIFDLAGQFTLQGHEVTVAGPAGDGQVVHSSEFYKLGSSFRFPTPGDAARINLNPLISRPVRRLLAERDFDVFHLHEPFLGYIGASFLRYGEGLKVGTFHTWRSGTHLPYKVFGPVVRRWNRKLHGRVAVSPSAAETINRYVPGHYHVIPNGIYFDDFVCPDAPPEHLDDQRPTILFVGRLEPRKGVPVLLEAFRRLKPALPRARLVIAGDGSMRKAWQQLAREKQIEDVIFEGYVPRDRLRAYYHRADVFCSPSIENESFGITLLEAMASGTPVIATSRNGSNTLGESGVTGLVVEPGNAGELSEAIQQLLQDRQLSERLAAAAQKRARDFDWSVVAASILDYYADVGRVREPLAAVPV